MLLCLIHPMAVRHEINQILCRAIFVCFSLNSSQYLLQFPRQVPFPQLQILKT